MKKAEREDGFRGDSEDLVTFLEDAARSAKAIAQVRVDRKERSDWEGLLLSSTLRRFCFTFCIWAANLVAVLKLNC